MIRELDCGAGLPPEIPVSNLSLSSRTPSLAAVRGQSAAMGRASGPATPLPLLLLSLLLLPPPPTRALRPRISLPLGECRYDPRGAWRGGVPRAEVTVSDRDKGGRRGPVGGLESVVIPLTSPEGREGKERGAVGPRASFFRFLSGRGGGFHSLFGHRSSPRRMHSRLWLGAPGC